MGASSLLRVSASGGGTTIVTGPPARFAAFGAVFFGDAVVDAIGAAGAGAAGAAAGAATVGCVAALRSAKPSWTAAGSPAPGVLAGANRRGSARAASTTSAESKASPIACNAVCRAEAGGRAAAVDAPVARGADWVAAAVDGGPVVAGVAGVFADGGVDIVASRRGAVVVRTPCLPSTPAETSNVQRTHRPARSGGVLKTCLGTAT
jgi:hypothetical protein